MKTRSLRFYFLLLLFISAAVHLIFSVYQKTALVYDDELYTLELAQNIWLRGSYSVYSSPAPFVGILYPLLLSPFYAISSGTLRTLFISAFNALLISSSLIPGYLLARQILRKPWQIMVALIALALSPNLLFSLTFMSENLWLPLLLWTFWALHRLLSEKANRPRNTLLLSLFVILLLLTGFSGLSVHPFSWEYFSIAPHMMYLLYIVLLMTLFSLISLFWFPVAVPFFSRRKLSFANKGLLYTAVTYSFCVMILTALKISLAEDFASLTPHICLRYLLGAGYPFLLLFLSLWEDREPVRWKSPLVVGTAVFAVSIVLFLFIPVRKDLTDFPALYLLTRILPASAKWLWLGKVALILFLAAALLLWNRQQKRLLACLLLVPLLSLELLSGTLFARDVRRVSRLTDPEALAEVQRLDETMDTMDGSILVVADDRREPLLKLLNTVSNNDYLLLTKDEVLDRVLEQGPEAEPVVSLEGHPVDDVVVLGSWDLMDPAKYTDVTPSDLPSFTLWKAEAPTDLSLLYPNTLAPGESIRFAGEDANYRRFYTTGFSAFEGSFTWTRKREVSLTLRPDVPEPCDLAVTWTWAMTNGDQSCEIYANDTPVCSQTLPSETNELAFTVPADSWSRTGSLTLRFVFQDARQPGNGDPRTLAVAFTSLTLSDK